MTATVMVSNGHGAAVEGESTAAAYVGQTLAEVEGKQVSVERSLALSVTAQQNAHVSDGTTGVAVAGQDLYMTNGGGIVFLAGQDVTLTNGGAGFLNAGRNVEVTNGGAGVVLAGGDVTINHAGDAGGSSLLLAGNQVQVNKGWVGAVFARNSQLDPETRVLIDLSPSKVIAAVVTLIATPIAIVSLLRKESKEGKDKLEAKP